MTSAPAMSSALAMVLDLAVSSALAGAFRLAAEDQRAEDQAEWGQRDDHQTD